MNKKKLLIQAIVVAVMVIFAWPIQAQGNVNVSLTAAQEQLTLGDPVDLTLQVTHPEGYQVIIPKLEQTWGPFEVKGQSQTSTTTNGDGTATTQQTIAVTLFELGTFETPALPFTVTDDANNVIDEIAPPKSLTVVPTLPEEQTTLNDIRPQATLDLPSLMPMILVGSLLALVVAAAGWMLYRRWRGKPLFGHVDNRPPHRRALDELDRIDGLALPQQARFKEHYTLTTDCLRSYLEAQFNLNVFEHTTSELKAVLQQSPLAAEHTRAFVEFFRESDFVKFTEFMPDVTEAQQITGQARTLVTMTKPVATTQSKSDNFEQSFGSGNSQNHVEAAI
jgi:hypothetical protein